VALKYLVTILHRRKGCGTKIVGNDIAPEEGVRH